MGVGFRIFKQRKVPPAEVVAAFGRYPAANIADAMDRLNSMGPEIRRMGPPADKALLGVALTVRANAGDNLMIHKALDMAGPGDVIVVSNEGARTQALVGEIMYGHAKSRGIEGFVLDGPIRDVDSLDGTSLPVFACGTRPGGPFKVGPGEINIPITCGGTLVNPGDIILGDSDGVVVIPRASASEVLAAVEELSRKDQSKVQASANGTLDRSWLDRTLADLGCEILDRAYE